MTRALERHEKKSARVIPIILRPCDWKSGPFKKLKALPTDGKAVTKYPDHHEAFLNIVEGIRAVATEMGAQGPSSPFQQRQPVVSKEPAAGERSSNLRTKKKFSERDRDKFFKDGFLYIQNFFEASLTELKTRTADVDYDLSPIDAMRFTAAIYREGEAESRCTVRLDRTGFNGITFLAGEDRSSGGSSFNQLLVVSDDGYSLFFQSGFGGDKEKQFTLQGAAEYFWGLFIEPLQR